MKTEAKISIKLSIVESLLRQANKEIEEAQNLDGLTKEYGKYLNYIQFQLDQMDDLIQDFKRHINSKGNVWK